MKIISGNRVDSYEENVIRFRWLFSRRRRRRRRRRFSGSKPKRHCSFVWRFSFVVKSERNPIHESEFLWRGKTFDANEIVRDEDLFHYAEDER